MREGKPTEPKGEEKMKYYRVIADFQIVRYADTLEEAERIYDKMIRDGMTYVELSLIIDFSYHKTYCLKTNY